MATLQYPNFPRASVLVLGSNTVQALLPSTLISQADALLLAHRLEDAADLAEQQRKRLQSMLNVERHEVSAVWSYEDLITHRFATGSLTNCAM